MSRLFFVVAFALGLAVVAWIGAGFVGSDPLALAFTGVIALVYCLGFGELVNFRRSTGQLDQALDTLPSKTDEVRSWLNDLPGAMQLPIQRRIEGHSAALSGPQLTPYLTSLLVMLGLLGTFAGMIVTLSGAASALDNSTELSAVRSALAAPIAGLSLAFGTSIAGVAASAMLGLASTLSRRERVNVSRRLDGDLRSKLRHLSGDYQREQAFQAIESQARALQEMASAMERMTARMEQLGERLEQSLTQNQKAFHKNVEAQYQELAHSVARSLEAAVQAGTRQTAEQIQPVVREAMDQLRADADAQHRNWSSAAGEQLAELANRFQATTTEATEHWQQTLAEQQHQQTKWLESQTTGLEQLTATTAEHLLALQTQEADRTDAISQRLEALEAAAAKHLRDLGEGLEAPMTRLIETASETPKAAAEVIRQLQAEMARNSERDNELLEERKQLVSELDALLANQREQIDGQRQAVDNLVNGAGDTLSGIGERFNALIGEQSQQLGQLGEHLTGSSQEVGALSDAFGTAIEQFSRSNEQVIASLADIQKALDNAGTRHDEQLAYYVAQAREVIDLSVSAQKDVIDAAAALRKPATEAV
jgi:DNA anti-recombination protein RmuC